jgi:Ca2+-transporting ATPase
VLLVVAGLACFAIAWVRFQQGHGVLDALLSAVTLAVAALPEEFPVVLTFFLGVGVYRLAKQRALVRRSVVVENIGRVSCICSDKTGTITEGRLQLTHRATAGNVSPERVLFLAAVAARRESADPMDSAILDALPDTTMGPSVANFPFTEDRKCETGIVRENGRLLAAVKGAPEVVLARCELEETERRAWLARVEELAAGGHKVIACASRSLNGADWSGGEPDRRFHFAGLLCFEDPVRAGVREALQKCRDAGIRVIMVTGDHPTTSRAVAREIGLGTDTPCIVEGDRMSLRLAQGDTSVLEGVDVIARAIPSQKLDLVRALQAGGEIVAVTGDGVNDVPALLAADIGIAMGERGTRSAREVASIVLLDDNFQSIVGAIAEGRQLFNNLQLSFQYLLMIHLPLVITAMLIPLAGYPLLYLPIHIVWLELIIHPTAMLVFQARPSVHELLPVKRRERLTFFDRGQWVTILVAGTVVTVVVGGSYLRSLGAGYDVEHARAMAMVVLTTASAAFTASLTRLRGPVARIVVIATMGLSVLLVQTPGLAALLHLKPLHVDDWMLAIGSGLLASLVVSAASLCRRLASVREALFGTHPRASPPRMQDQQR